MRATLSVVVAIEASLLDPTDVLELLAKKVFAVEVGSKLHECINQGHKQMQQ